MRKLGIITILTVLMLNIIVNNVMAKDACGKVSLYSYDEAKEHEYYTEEADYNQKILQSEYKSLPLKGTCTDKNIYSSDSTDSFNCYNPSIRSQYKQEAAPSYSEYNPWEQPEYTIPKPEATSSHSEYDPWAQPEYKTPKPEATSSHSEYDPWAQPEYKIPKPEATSSHSEYNPWAQPEYKIPKPEATSSHSEYNPWAQPEYKTPKPEATSSHSEYNAWAQPEYKTPKPEATSSHSEYNPWAQPEYKTPKPEATSSHSEYNPWAQPEYKTPKPEVTPSHSEYNPWAQPEYKTPKPEVTSSHSEYNPWAQPYYNVYNPWAVYYSPYTASEHKKENFTKGVVEPQTDEEKFDYTESVLSKQDSSLGSELTLINFELEKARQKLFLIRGKAKYKIGAELKETRQRISSIVSNNSIDSKNKNLEIKKLKKTLENEVNSIKEDAAEEVKIVIDKQNLRIKEILK